MRGTVLYRASSWESEICRGCFCYSGGFVPERHTGWGKMHSAYFRMAVTSTGLTSSQVKVKSVSRVAVSDNRPGYISLT